MLLLFNVVARYHAYFSLQKKALQLQQPFKREQVVASDKLPGGDDVVVYVTKSCLIRR